eukprot:RCo009015
MARPTGLLLNKVKYALPRQPVLKTRADEKDALLILAKDRPAFAPARISALETPFVYTEHNRIAVSGTNGTFAYKTPNLCRIRQSQDIVSMDVVTVVDMHRAFTRTSALRLQALYQLMAKHYDALRKVCMSITFVDTMKLALVGRMYRFDYKNSLKSVNMFAMKFGGIHIHECEMPFKLSTAVTKDISGHTVISISSLPFDTPLRDKAARKLFRIKPTEKYTGKGFCYIDPKRPLYLSGKGPPM